MKKICIGTVPAAAVFFVAILSACSDSSSNSNVYSCDQLTVEEPVDHICYESSEENFTECKDGSIPFQRKTTLTPGRGCPSGALKICDAELVPGHPYTIYVYNEETAQMSCKRNRGF